MARRRNRNLGLVVLIAGLASSIYGYIQYENASRTLGASLRRVFDQPSPELSQAVVIVIAGLAVALVGAVLILRR
ncbi:MAG: DUF3185 family protein [Alkalispirochaetaceae bacterium]